MKTSNSESKASHYPSAGTDEKLRVNWPGLCDFASSKNSGLPCTILSDHTFGGARHIVELLSFGHIKWIVRIQREPSTPSTARSLRAEIDTMELVRTRTNIPVPKIYAYELDDTNIVGAPFILMEYLPGESAMDADGGYQVHQGQVPVARRDSFYKEVASIQVQLASIRMPKIGSIIRRGDNEFDIGPLPGLGGPFSTASDFFEAWARQARFPLSDEIIRQNMKMANGPVEEVLQSIRGFPDALARLAPRLSAHNNGPFPLYHPDFYHSNIIVGKDFNILGVIDWEIASTVPWELVEFPLFLSMLPPTMTNPDNYGYKRLPMDEYTKVRHFERAAYVELVAMAEQELLVDQELSGVLRDPDMQDLAYAIKVYHDPGKLGFYCEILKPFDARV